MSTKIKAVTAAAPAPAPAPTMDAEQEVRNAFHLALLAQLQSGECSAAWAEVGRKYLNDQQQARQWQVERAELELTANKGTQPAAALPLSPELIKKFPFPVPEQADEPFAPRNEFEVE